MVNFMVERATSDMLIGPDWATNIEICDMLNRDPGQAKDIVRGIKRRLGSKNPKVQILSLTLLETIIKNCGDIVHMHVADKDVLHEMVKIVKKKPDFNVKEKILVLIDTWQEAFGGPMARYPQYYAAYQELLRAGAVFPQRSERSAPVLTPPQTQALTSYPPNLRNQDFRPEVGDSSRGAEFPTLSLREIQNAREIMDVLTEMLNAIDPNKKEGLGQDVIVDLVDQCRTYKQRVVHLVNSTSDESLLCEGLALNDDLQRLLAKHEAIVSGTYIPEDTAKHEPPQPPPTVITGSLVDTGSSSAAMPPPQPPPGLPQASVKTNLDLLSGDDYNSPTTNNTALALVPVGDMQPKSPVSDQNAIVLFDMFPQSPDNPNPPNSQAGHQSEQAHHTSLQIPQQPIHNIQPFQPSFNHAAAAPSMNFPESNIQPPYTYGPPSIASNVLTMHQQERPDSTSHDTLPPPPWEALPLEVSQNLEASHVLPPSLQNSSYAQGYPPTGGGQVGVYSQPSPMFNNFTSSQSNQFTGLQHYPQFSSPQQPVYAPVYGYVAGYGGYVPKEQSQFVAQRMNGLSLGEHGYLGTSFAASSAPSYVKNTPNPSRPEDKLFGDLVDMAKIKPSKPTIDGSRSK